jgi:DNA-binding XRE family transcriptional regulator
MSEPTGAPVEGSQDVEQNPQGEPGDTPLGPNGEKALRAEREARAAAEKAAADYKAKLDEIEKASRSELEKAQEAQAQLAEITRQSTVNKVALEKGVPADLVEFLTGDNEEAIAAKADLLLARLNAPKTPKPDPSQGAGPGEGKASAADSFAEFFTSHLGG